MNLKRLAERLGLSNEDKKARMTLLKQDKFMTDTDAENIVCEQYVQNKFVEMNNVIDALVHTVGDLSTKLEEMGSVLLK